MKFTADQVTMETGPMGPIGENNSLMLRINRNCPWNQCLFCYVYKGLKFSRRSEAELIADIDSLARVCELLDRTSFDIGLGGRIQREVVQALIKQRPDLYGEYPLRINQRQLEAFQTLNNVASWAMRGSRKVFLQDADALNMKTDELCRIICHLKKLFPTIDGISTFARTHPPIK